MTYYQSVCVFCGGAPFVSQDYLEAARRLGHLLAQEGIELVYGGGEYGLMGEISKAAMEKGGQVIGFLPEDLISLEQGNSNITKLTIVTDMHMRKKNMYLQAEAFVVLPGGFGTLEEMFEVMTYKIIGFLNKPIIILDVNGYWQPLRQMLDRLLEEKFAKFEERSVSEVYQFVDTIEALMDLLHKKEDF